MLATHIITHTLMKLLTNGHYDPASVIGSSAYARHRSGEALVHSIELLL